MVRDLASGLSSTTFFLWSCCDEFKGTPRGLDLGYSPGYLAVIDPYFLKPALRTGAAWEWL